MHFFILGATGRTGVYGYKYALEQGHHVTALVRNASSLDPHPNLTIAEGSPLSEEDMTRAATAAGIPIDSALIFLNSRRTSDWLWATFIGPARLIADSTALTAKVLRNQAPLPDGRNPRLVVLNALGAGKSYEVTPYIMRFIINYSNVGYTYEDHNGVIDEIDGNCGDKVDYTVALPPGLGAEGKKEVKVFGETESGSSLWITRESLARWMVDVAADKGGELRNKKVIVSN